MYKSFLAALLFFLFMLVVGALIHLITRKKQKNSKFTFSGFKELNPKNMVLLFKLASYFLLSTGLVFLLLSIARPQEKSLEMRKTDKGIDILFVLDISDSMLIEDMKPYENRLESAKFHIKQFIEKRTSDRMGLVVFSGEAYTRVPLTVDHSLLLQNLEGLQVSEHMKKGTAIGVALGAAVNRVRESKSKSKIVVLLTDGENNTGVIDPLTALELAVAEESKVYTIGMGRNGQSMLPVFSKDRQGRKIKSYRPFPTQINEELLQKMATQTGGQFYRASKESDMSRVFNSIDDLEKSDFKLPKTYKIVEKYQFPLAVGLLCFFILFFGEILFFWKGY